MDISYDLEIDFINSKFFERWTALDFFCWVRVRAKLAISFFKKAENPYDEQTQLKISDNIDFKKVLLSYKSAIAKKAIFLKHNNFSK